MAPAPVPDRERKVYIAKLAEEANRYEDVIPLMKEVAEMNVELTTEERKLMSTAYHNVIASLLRYWKTLKLTENEQKMEGEMEFVPKIEEFVEKVAGEINDFCTDATSLLTRHVLPHCTSPEDQVFYYTMMGDCYGYLAGVTNEDLIQRDELIQNGMTAYGEGITIAEENLHAADPTRLALALNFSVFYYEILRSVKNALKVARLAVGEVNKEVMMDVFSLETMHYLDGLNEHIVNILGVHANVEKGRVKAGPRIDDDFLPLIKEVVKWAKDNVVNVAATLEGPELVD